MGGHFMMFRTFRFRKETLEKGDSPDIYTYDQAPPQMRHQICCAFSEGIGEYHVGDPYFGQSNSLNANKYWRNIDNICRKEIYSYLNFVGKRDIKEVFLNFLLQENDVDDFLSGVEIGCLCLTIVDDRFVRTALRGAVQSGVAALSEINTRFQQHSVGYQFENKNLIRVDSKIAHAEIVKPALKLLESRIFAKANDDFMTAHLHYRSGKYKDCVVSSNRAFESMLKAICDDAKWKYEKGSRASELISLVTKSGLFTHNFDRSFDSYVATLRSGLPAVRNDAGGHGDGAAAAAVTAEIARYAIHLTATNLLFLGESYELLLKRKK
jgi:hypothetical protein